ncbi:uncharacterized protein BYT42DRAFT_535894 [Radiomyces spectabilis]|uniref:uncharacterized protein n=1 Tax=Radiomyces spectabilis TaxID=64574 RepID=UPI00221F46DF|nr:uncharacterized protein BYT42DRAFT_535894 [Radiomyces spectabilis]KAI8374641.1 hypothetical protein BYT42DRAFT_535894 [Radiomyces spectabilis]
MPRCLPNLVRLRVVANSIRQIPATIAAWQSMCHLLLNCNQLETIPEAIVAMPSLELLDISHNRLKALPDYLNFPKLSYLNASNNALRHLPSSIAQSQHLSTLDLSRNRLTSLPIDLARLALSQINVCENQLCIIPSDILEKRSTSVLLTGNPLTHDFVGQQQRQISDSLKTFKDMLRHMAGRPWIVHHQHSATTKNSDEMTFAKVDYLTHASPTTWPSKPGIQPLPDNDAYIDHYLSFHAQSLRLYGNNRSHGPFTKQQHDVGSLQIQQTNDVTTDENTGDGYGWSPPPCHLLHSLRELAFRTLLNTQHDLSPKATALWPDRVVADIHHIFSCRQCGQPYVKEWVSSVSLKTYRGHPSVVQKQRFCSLSCWRSYVSKYKTKAANRRPVHHPPLPRQGAGGGGGGGGGTWVPGSMQWIMAAVTASEEQGDEDWVF